MKARKTPFTLVQKIKFTAIIFLFFAFLVSIGSELLLRKFAPQFGPPCRAMTDFFYSQEDELLGWKIQANFSQDFDYLDYAGEHYKVSIRYDENSFKAFGDINSSRPKILFIGDSYTASVEVSNEKSYFNLLKDSLNAEIFAIGAGGYGSLQEYLVLDQWVDIIQPDLVVLQVCNNDFVDNYPQLERLSGYKVGERRPYLDFHGEIFYERPVTFWEDTQKKSYLAKWLDTNWEGVKEKMGFEKEPLAELHITEQKLAYPPFSHSVKITSDIIQKIKERLPNDTQLLAFSSDAFEPQRETFKQIFAEHEIPFTDDPALYCRNMSWNGKNPFSKDGYHWNEYGHSLIAWGLRPHIAELLAELDLLVLSEH